MLIVGGRHTVFLCCRCCQKGKLKWRSKHWQGPGFCVDSRHAATFILTRGDRMKPRGLVSRSTTYWFVG
jgi:hypothetical protein